MSFPAKTTHSRYTGGHEVSILSDVTLDLKRFFEGDGWLLLGSLITLQPN
jgi:hypothetical protein